MNFSSLVLIACVSGTLAADFVQKTIEVELNAGTPAPTLNLVYYLKKPDNFKANGPVFYATTGREGASTAKEKFKLFELVSPDYKDAAIVFVDQRFYGESTKTIATLADLAPLTMRNIVNDHVKLIQFLSGADQLNTKNFLVFGGGYGGLIAGYVANHFATTAALKDTYKVLGWSSSTPIKQIRQGSALTNQLNDMSEQFKVLVDTGTADCVNANLQKLDTFFDNIKKLGSAQKTSVDKFNLSPLPRYDAATNKYDADDLKELAVFVRKQILNLLFDNFPYMDGNSGSYQVKPRKINKLCKALSLVTPLQTSTTVIKEFNTLFSVLGGRKTTPLKWRLNNDGTAEGKVNQALVVSAYQDCTEHQIAACYKSPDDFFVKSRWNNEECTDLNKVDTFDTMIEAECKGLFRGFTDIASVTFNSKRIAVEFPSTLNTHVVTTMNAESIFACARDPVYFANDKGDFGNFWQLKLTDNWEFQEPRECDSDKMKDVRYLVLRAFACLAGLFDDTNNQFCDKSKTFDDGKGGATDADTLKKQCGIASAVRFPFDGAKIPFDGSPTYSTNPSTDSPTNSPTNNPTDASASTTTTVLPSVKSSTTSIDDTTDDCNGFVASSIVLLLNVIGVWIL